MHVVEAFYADGKSELFGVFATATLAVEFGERMKATAEWMDYYVRIVHPVVD